MNSTTIVEVMGIGLTTLRDANPQVRAISGRPVGLDGSNRGSNGARLEGVEMAESKLSTWTAAMRTLADEWDELLRVERAAERSEVAGWHQSISEMRQSHLSLVAAGKWTRGPSELLAVLGDHHNEVRNCRVLRWLLDPEGPHGLGHLMLHHLFRRLHLDVDPALLASAEVLVEVASGTTRADIVIRAGDVLVIAEAKIYAPEGRLGQGQCAELESEWADESPTFIFLTLRGTPPRTASNAGRWHSVRWADLADDLDAALEQTDDSGAAGRRAANEYLAASRRYLT